MAGTGLPSGALTQNNPALGTDARANGAGARTRQGGVPKTPPIRLA